MSSHAPKNVSPCRKMKLARPIWKQCLPWSKSENERLKIIRNVRSPLFSARRAITISQHKGCTAIFESALVAEYKCKKKFPCQVLEDVENLCKRHKSIASQMWLVIICDQLYLTKSLPMLWKVNIEQHNVRTEEKKPFHISVSFSLKREFIFLTKLIFKYIWIFWQDSHHMIDQFVGVVWVQNIFILKLEYMFSIKVFYEIYLNFLTAFSS